LGGWRVSSFLTIMSGLPLYFTLQFGLAAAPGNTQTPNLVAPVHILHGVGLGNPWFTTASFAAPTGTAFGNVGRNYLSGLTFSIWMLPWPSRSDHGTPQLELRWRHLA